MDKPDMLRPTEPIPAKSTAVKTDKPRPHVCTTCTRSFARLEHLKRHERSHTKEKPFQCPVCERCFARRDLLLRHKQKLHASFPNESRPKSVVTAVTGRRNSRKISTSAPSAKKEDSRSPSGDPAGTTSPPSLYSSVLKNKVGSVSGPATAAGGGGVSGAGNPRTRTVSFSAATSTSYASNKQIEEYNSHPEFHPSSGPSQVGFSTPQLVPTFSDSSDSNAVEDFFTASDPLYINPQQLFGGGAPNNAGAGPASAVATAGLGASGGAPPHDSTNFDRHHSVPELPLHHQDHALRSQSVSQAVPQAAGMNFNHGGVHLQSQQPQHPHQQHPQQHPQHPQHGQHPQPQPQSSPGLPQHLLAMHHSYHPHNSNDDDFSWLSPSHDGHPSPTTTPQSILSAGHYDNPNASATNGPGSDRAPSHGPPGPTGAPGPMALSATEVSASPTGHPNGVSGPNPSNGVSDHGPGAGQGSDDVFTIHFSGFRGDKPSGAQVGAVNGHNNDHHGFGNGHDLTHGHEGDMWIGDESFWKMSAGAHVSQHDDDEAAGGEANINLKIHGQGDKLGPSSEIKTSHTITPHLRVSILTTLSNPAPFSSSSSPNLPSTLELQRYINAYVENFGKHVPFIHHSFEFDTENVAVALGMAAIGALYSFEQTKASTIFEISRCCIHHFMELRKSTSTVAGANSNGIGSGAGASVGDKNWSDVLPVDAIVGGRTPLWLVQALTLGVIYGLFSDEPVANEVAVAQANAVISLAKSSNLHNSPIGQLPPLLPNSTVDDKWKYFVSVQERIRTMHVVHITSCLLTSAYGINTQLSNKEINCGTPCDESLWSAPNAQTWSSVMAQKDLDINAVAGSAATGLDFNELLGQLLQSHPIQTKVPQFLFLSLMYAIHLEIHELKTAHDRDFIMDAGRRGDDAVAAKAPHSPNKKIRRNSTMGEFVRQRTQLVQCERDWLESNRVRVESVLRAWETTWSMSPLASLNPSSQYGPLMSDSIPLSTLAHVRVYLDLRRVKDAFWRRDFDTMGTELENLIVPRGVMEAEDGSKDGGKQFDGLLEAASHAADTVSLWEKNSVKWTLETSVSQTFIHTIVALFDCGLVVSEFLNRLESNKAHHRNWNEDEQVLVSRVIKIFYRVIELLGPDGIDEDMSAAVLDLDSKPQFEQSGRRLSILSLQVVSKILSKSYIWPFAVVMSNALQARVVQIKKQK